MASVSNTAVGRVLLVQENRFRLLRPKGQSLLFSLGPSAKEDAADLRAWHEAGTEVMVRYSGEPDLDTGVAHAVEPAALAEASEGGGAWEA